jgi:cytochrome c oxidase subunit 1
MSSDVTHSPAGRPAPAAGLPAEHYLTHGWDLKSWLLTKDHKRIGLLYLVSITFFFAIGSLYAGIVRWNLLVPDGSHMSADAYNKAFTGHGVVMVFFFLIPSIPTTLGNFLLPLMIGAKDLAFPKLNLLSWYIFMIGAGITLYALMTGGLDTGWTFYTPYSTVFAQSKVELAAIGIFVAGFSSILTGLNFIVTVHTMRAPGMTWFRMPLFVWAHYATALIQVLGTPVIAITILLVALERIFHFGFFDPNRGGDPILFQHLFWFYSHPAVYIMILPSMGVISEVITCFSRKRIFGYSFIAMSSLAIAAIGFLVWAHHMFVTGISVYSAMVFSALTYLVAVPSAIKTFNWTATLYKGSVEWDTPMIYVFCFIGLFLIGGLTGLFLGNLGLDVHLTDTYFVVAHFHYIMVGGAIMGYLGGLHFWWPKITGRKYVESWGKVSSLLIFVGFNLTFFPQFLLGYLGMPRRYHVYPEEFQVLNVLSTAGATILGFGYLFPFSYLFHSIFRGEPAGDNPWGAKGLEWTTTSPPPTANFELTPVVTEEPYDYASGGKEGVIV